MNKSLYFPYLNIPESCPALGTLLLLSDEINIIAPARVPIDGELTKRFLDEGLLHRISPVDYLSTKDLDDIVEKTIKYRAGSVRNEIPVHLEKFRKFRDDDLRDDIAQLHVEKLGRVHPSKFESKAPILNVNKIGVHWEKVINSRGLGKIDSRGFIQMPADKAMYLMGQIAKKISFEKRLKVFSTVDFDTSPNPNALRMRDYIEASTLDLLPSVDYSHHKFNLDVLHRVREEYMEDLQYYAQNVSRDLKATIEYWNEGFIEYPERGMQFILDAKNDLHDRYSREYRQLCDAMAANDKIRLYTVGIGVVLPSVLSVAAGHTSDYASALNGLGSIATMAGALFQNKDIPNRISRHKIVYNIRRNKKLHLR